MIADALHSTKFNKTLDDTMRVSLLSGGPAVQICPGAPSFPRILGVFSFLEFLEAECEAGLARSLDQGSGRDHTLHSRSARHRRFRWSLSDPVASDRTTKAFCTARAAMTRRPRAL
jgi:hypothetical protein